MSDPIFVLGCHRSGTSVVAGLLYHACGVSMGELMPPTEDNPLGYFEAIGVVDAHRNLLAQLERDWTCPPTTFRPDLMNLSALSEQVEIHKSLPGVWAMKDHARCSCSRRGVTLVSTVSDWSQWSDPQ